MRLDRSRKVVRSCQAPSARFANSVSHGWIVAWANESGARHEGDPRRIGSGHAVKRAPGRTDRRGADVDPARRHARVDHDAHARPRLRAGGRVLLHRRDARRCAGHAACATAPTAAPWRVRVQRRHRRDRRPGPAPTPRLGNMSSSCGSCGTEQLDDLCRTPRAAAADRAVRPRRCCTRSRTPSRPSSSCSRRPVRPRRGGVRSRRSVARHARGRRPAQRRRQGRRVRWCSTGSTSPPPTAARPLRQRPGEHRDGAEGVGGRVRAPSCR